MSIITMELLAVTFANLLVLYKIARNGLASLVSLDSVKFRFPILCCRASFFWCDEVRAMEAQGMNTAGIQNILDALAAVLFMGEIDFVAPPGNSEGYIYVASFREGMYYHTMMRIQYYPIQQGSLSSTRVISCT